MTGLTDGTTYYVRAYAINSVGIAYGEERCFTTTTKLTVTTRDIVNITSVAALGGGNVIADGGYEVRKET